MKEKVLFIVVGVLLILNISNYFEIKKINSESGSSKHYFRDGSLSLRQHYDDGTLDGSSESWYKNGRKQSETTYRNGERDGVYLSWYENGKIKEISNWANGLRIGWQREYLENGKLLYEVNLIEGNGIISFKDYKTGIQIIQNYIGGKEVYPLNGKVNKIRATGIIDEISIANGESNGLRRRIDFRNTNRKPSESNFKNGVEHGFEKDWHDNGKLRHEGEYFFRQKNGLWKEWYENGKRKTFEKYDFGILVSKKCWDESGKKIDCECYNNNDEKIKCP